MRAREYDPGTAQFLSVDHAVTLTRAPYTYAGDNPLIYKDRSGLGIEEGSEDGSGIPCVWCEAKEGVEEGIDGAYHTAQHTVEKVWDVANENEGLNDEGEAALREKVEGGDACNPTPPGYDPDTWIKGPASRAKEPSENYMTRRVGSGTTTARTSIMKAPHWDYKRLPGKLSPWEEIPIE